MALAVATVAEVLEATAVVALEVVSAALQAEGILHHRDQDKVGKERKGESCCSNCRCFS